LLVPLSKFVVSAQYNNELAVPQIPSDTTNRVPAALIAQQIPLFVAEEFDVDGVNVGVVLVYVPGVPFTMREYQIPLLFVCVPTSSWTVPAAEMVVVMLLFAELENAVVYAENVGVGIV